MPMNNFGQRLKEALKQKRMSQRELADRLKVSQQAVSYLTRQEQENSKYTEEIATILGISPSWLKYGENLPQEEQAESTLLVPIIEWADVASDTMTSNRNIICPIRHSPKAYATYVPGPAMHGPTGRCYPDESIIFVDPNQLTPPTNRTPVIARLLDTNDITFRMYYNDGSERYLAALNTDYPPTHSRPFEIIGTVIAGMVI